MSDAQKTYEMALIKHAYLPNHAVKATEMDYTASYVSFFEPENHPITKDYYEVNGFALSIQLAGVLIQNTDLVPDAR